jgi:RNA polymerase sigma-70 factor (ECF subfamily)
MSDPMPRRGPSQEALFRRLVFDTVWKIVWPILVRSRVGKAERPDLAQEIIIRVWQMRERYRAARGSPKQWVRTIAKRMVIDFLRKRGQVVPDDLPETLADEARTPEEHVEWSQLAQLADEVVQGLPEEERRVLILHEIEGKNFDEIAKLLGISKSTAHARFTRGMEKLKKAKEDGTLDTIVVPIPLDDPPTPEMLDRAWQRFVDSGALDLPPDSDPPPSGTRRTGTPSKIRKLGPLMAIFMGPGLVAPRSEPPAPVPVVTTVVAPATTSIPTEPITMAAVSPPVPRTALRSSSPRRVHPVGQVQPEHGGADTRDRFKIEASSLGEAASR